MTLSARQKREEAAKASSRPKPKKPPRKARKQAKPVEVDKAECIAEWNVYDTALRSAAIECGKMIEVDLEVRRMALSVAVAPGLEVERDVYERMEENIDRKLRGLLAAREVGSRFTGPSITMVAVVDRRAELLLVNCAMKWKRKTVRARIEARIDLASIGAEA